MYRFTTTMMIFVLGLGHQLGNAASPGDVPSVTVHFADLDLSHSQGVTVLYRRLKDAAETVCAAQDSRDLERQMRFKACGQAALSTAVTKVDQPALTAYYQAQFKGRNATGRCGLHCSLHSSAFRVRTSTPAAIRGNTNAPMIAIAENATSRERVAHSEVGFE